jgi:hypothetical protein
MSRGIDFRIKDNLRYSFAVAQIDENKPTMIATTERPPHQDNFTADV